MHSYRMAAHEQRAAEIVRALYPDLPLTLSAEVAPEIREFERTSTACANAYVQPLMQRYLDRLEASLGEIGLSGRLYVMLSGGGITTVREARNFPIRLIESGPAAGRDGRLAHRPALRPRQGRLLRHGRDDRENVPGGERRAGSQVRVRGRAGAALPERIRPAAQGFGDRHDRDRRGRRQPRPCRSGIATAEGRAAQRRRPPRPGLLRRRRHASRR